MKKIEVFFPFTKIDVEKREVWGRITQEAPDKSNEIFDYDTSVPFFKAWNEEFTARTDGESVGNVREMHQPSAVGKFIAMEYLDDEKAIDAGCKVTDDGAWQKVLDKVYTGFSVGGGYVKKWKDGNFTRFTAKPSETSLVDNPCLGKAAFTQIIKMDGDDAQATVGELRKGMGALGDLAQLIQWLGWMCTRTADEAEQEGDNSPVPAELVACLTSLIEAFKAMTTEETSELLTYIPAPADQPDPEIMAMAAKLAKGEGFEDLLKAKFTAVDKTKLETLHKVAVDAVNALAEVWAENPDAEVTGSEKGAAAGDLQKMATLETDLAKAADDLTKAHSTIDTLTKRIQELEALPAPPKGVINANVTVSKSDDAADADLLKQAEAIDKLPPEEQARLLIKAAHQARR